MTLLCALYGLAFLTDNLSANPEYPSIFSKWGYTWLNQELLVTISSFSDPDLLFKKKFNLKDDEDLYRIIIYDYKPRDPFEVTKLERRIEITDNFELSSDDVWKPITFTTEGYKVIDKIDISTNFSHFINRPDTYIFLIIGTGNVYKIKYDSDDVNVLKIKFFNDSKIVLIKKRLLEYEGLEEYLLNISKEIEAEQIGP